MASGVCTVASRIGGIPEIIADGENGRLFSAVNDGDLANVASALLADHDQRQRLAIAGRRTVEERYTHEQMMRATLGIYHQGVQRRDFAVTRSRTGTP
jgi:starch synthase